MTLYVIVSLIAVFMTYQEQKRRKIPSPMFSMIGFVLCALWPLVMAALLVSVRITGAHRQVAQLD